MKQIVSMKKIVQYYQITEKDLMHAHVLQKLRNGMIMLRNFMKKIQDEDLENNY